jgi:hypothetical protein
MAMSKKKRYHFIIIDWLTGLPMPLNTGGAVLDTVKALANALDISYSRATRIAKKKFEAKALPLRLRRNGIAKNICYIKPKKFYIERVNL